VVQNARIYVTTEGTEFFIKPLPEMVIDLAIRVPNKFALRLLKIAECPLLRRVIKRASFYLLSLCSRFPLWLEMSDSTNHREHRWRCRT
jgi:hypothetical protein